MKPREKKEMKIFLLFNFLKKKVLMIKIQIIQIHKHKKLKHQ